MARLARSPLGTPICPYCGQLVQGGKVVLLRSGGQAHARCKHKWEQNLRDERERERLEKKLAQAMEAGAEALRKGVNHE